VQNEPWLQRDRAMVDQLKSLGIEKGKPFKPDDQTKELLEAGVREAQAWLEAKYNAGLPPYFSDISHGTYPAYPEVVEAMQAAYANPDVYRTDSQVLFTVTLLLA
jgi:hypothetical protein